jgi:hypothetical protein
MTQGKNHRKENLPGVRSRPAENVPGPPKHFQAKWEPVRAKKMQKKERAFSSEAGAGSRKENAMQQRKK